jgi:hypothetical protein
MKRSIQHDAERNDQCRCGLFPSSLSSPRSVCVRSICAPIAVVSNNNLHHHHTGGLLMNRYVGFETSTSLESLERWDMGFCSVLIGLPGVEVVILEHQM